MPRAVARIRKRWSEGTDVLCSEVEETLLRGRGVLGVAIELRTVEDWQRCWEKWRSTIMPKALEHFPGSRPVACYVTGEIPMRPVVVDPPLSHNWFRHYLPSRNGTGLWLCDYPEPYMQAEVNYLTDLGIVDDEEFRRHKAWRRERHAYRGPYSLGGYTLEQGLYV